MERRALKIGTRGSTLALKQSAQVRATLARLYPRLQIDLVVIKTTGDTIQNVPLADMGGKGLFVKEIEEALLNNRIDLAVHSMKDMPGELSKGLTIGAVPKREDPRDVFISKDGVLLKDVPEGGRIGTGSLRRKAQLLHHRPDLQVIPLRGNVETRIKKMEPENLDGLILAAAGLHRIDLEDRISQYLDLEISLPAVGQGALALETTENNLWLQDLLQEIHDEETALCTRAERAFLSRLQGGCQVPVAAHARRQGEGIVLKGLIAALDGKVLFQDQVEGPFDRSTDLGIELAERLLLAGGREILDQVCSKGLWFD
jgi:hydroxymethylbilane synthase